MHAKRCAAEQLELGRGKSRGAADREERRSDVHSRPLHRVRFRLHLLAHRRSTEYSFFVLADHIQTAVHIFGFVSVILGASSIFTLVFVYAGFAVTQSDQFRKVAAGLFLIVFCLIGLGIATTGFNPVNLFDRATVFVMSVGLLVMVVLGILFHRPKATEGGPRHRPLTVRKAFWAVVPLFLVLTMADAMIRAWSTWDTAPTSHDVVRLEHDSTVTGSLIELVDRGVILRDHKDGRVVFVPKEQLGQIDRGAPELRP